jgi:Flagellar biosynthesis protein, FliO
MIELLVRLAISMAVVMAVMGLAARFVRRRQEGGLGGGGFSARRTGRGLGSGGSSGFGRSRGSGGSNAGGPGGPALGRGGNSGGRGPGAGGPGAGGPGLAGPGGPSTLATKLGSLLGAPKPRRARPAAPFEIVYRRALSKGAAVAVIEATGKQFLLGITEQSITLLTELPSSPDPTPLDAEDASAASAAWAASAASATSPTAPSSTPAPAPGTRSGTSDRGAQVSDLEIWDEFDDWQQADRMPASPPDATTLERQNAWKLTLDSLRERTIRR